MADSKEKGRISSHNLAHGLRKLGTLDTPFEQVSNDNIYGISYVKELSLLNTTANFFSPPEHYQRLSLKISFKEAYRDPETPSGQQSRSTDTE